MEKMMQKQLFIDMFMGLFVCFFFAGINDYKVKKCSYLPESSL